MALHRLTERAANRRRCAVAVSLDIANAFNTLPYSCIRLALRFHGLPLYLKRIIENYLEDREVMYAGSQGQLLVHQTVCGVPQGLVLGPLLWNLGYGWVLQGAL